MSIVMAESIPTESIGAFRKPAIPTAKEINEAHKLAVSSAEGAVDSAIKCGQLLRAKMDELQHGERQEWIEKNCSFSHSTAKLYMSAAKQNAKGVAFSSLRHLYPSGKTSARVSAIPLESGTSEQTANGVSQMEPQTVDVILDARATTEENLDIAISLLRRVLDDENFGIGLSDDIRHFLADVAA